MGVYACFSHSSNGRRNRDSSRVQRRLDRRVLQGWNLLMAGVLVVTMVTGGLAAPSPFRQIMGDPPNAFVAGFPYVWIPTVLVCSAWLGHIVLFRRLRRV